MTKIEFIAFVALVIIAAGILWEITREMKPKPPIKCETCKNLMRIEDGRYICSFLNDGYSREGATYCATYKRRETHADEE